MKKLLPKSMFDALGMRYMEIEDESAEEIADFSQMCREEALDRNAEVVSCPYCHKVGNYPNMMRWHFEGCALKETRYCKCCSGPIPKTVKPSLYAKMVYCNQQCYFQDKVGKPAMEMTSEVCQKLSNAMTGKQWTEERRLEKSRAMTGVKRGRYSRRKGR